MYKCVVCGCDRNISYDGNVSCNRNVSDDRRVLSPYDGFASDPVVTNEWVPISESESDTKIDCPVCGAYKINLRFYPDMDMLINETIKELGQDYFKGRSKSEVDNKRLEIKAMLKYHVKKYSTSSKYDSNILNVDLEWCKEILKEPFSSPIKQLNYLITFLGDVLSRTHRPYYDYASEYLVRLHLISATASIDYGNVSRIIEHAAELNFIKRKENSLDFTIQGWTKYEELKKSVVDSKIVFMAMSCGKEQRKGIEEIVKPVIEKFGFGFGTLPGLYTQKNIIDLKLRNAIRDSRLLICDLTGINDGAYFEAGFAEGLGKPVIYICELSSFENKSEELHFDIEHQEIYKWRQGNEDSIKKFQDDLVAKIRVSSAKSN
jgi:nucleoside 2-deoxyribosyltransferase